MDDDGILYAGIIPFLLDGANLNREKVKYEKSPKGAGLALRLGAAKIAAG